MENQLLFQNFENGTSSEERRRHHSQDLTFLPSNLQTTMNNDLTLGTPSVPVGDESQPNFSFQIRQLVLVNYPY